MTIPLPTAELAKYLGASITGTAVHYLLLFVLVRIFTFGPVPASSCGAVAGAVIIYTLNYYYAFRSSRKHTVALSRFALIAVVGLVVNGTVLNAALAHLDWPVGQAQVLATVVQFWFGFFFNRICTF